MRRGPQRTRIHAIRIKLQHAVVQFFRDLRHLAQSAEVANVLPRGFDVPRAIVAVWDSVSRDDRSGLQCLDLVQRCDPFESRFSIRFCEIRMNAVVDGISSDNEPQRRDMQAG